MNAIGTSGAPLIYSALASRLSRSARTAALSGGEGTAHGPLSLGREGAGVQVRRQFANYSGYERKAGMTSRAKRVSCSTMRSLGVPMAQAIMTWSSPGYRSSISFR